MTTLRRRGALVIALLALIAAPGAAHAATFANPVLPGDHPDPTVVRADGAFYASATSASWAPIFPIFRSTDLVRWRQVGAVLPSAPRWAAGNFWAPELVRWSGRMLAFYSASRRGGPPCLGVASAPRPEGPWRDRGPVLCRPGGVIDVDPFTDADGARWLLFKRLGSGHGIYAMRFSERRLRAVGHAHELLAPDAGWEQGVTEGPALVRRGGSYLLFYAGGHCCRPPCTYAEGVARSSSMLGPYVKDPANPLLVGNAAWQCPGHGTTIDLAARRPLPAAPRLPFRRRVRPPALRTARPRRLHAGRLAHHRGRPRAGAHGRRPARQRRRVRRRPASPTASPAARWHRAGSGPSSPRPTRGPTAAPLRLTCRGARRPSFLARQVPVDRFTALATVAVPRRHGPGIGLAAHGPGRVLRGIELRDGRVRAFRSRRPRAEAGTDPARSRRRAAARWSSARRRTAPSASTWRTPRRADAHRGRPRRGRGLAATRLALTCRGTGATRIDSIRVAATGEAPLMSSRSRRRLVVSARPGCSPSADAAVRVRTRLRALPRPGALPRSPSSHVAVIVMENEEYGEVVGSRSAPTSTPSPDATPWPDSYAIGHPSLPNYLALTSGSTYGIDSDCTGCSVAGPNIVDQLEGSHITWKAYMEDLPQPCLTGASAGAYAKKHDPFVYYDDDHPQSRELPQHGRLGRLVADLRAGALPSFTMDLAQPLPRHARLRRRHAATASCALVPALLRELGPHGFLVLTWDEGQLDAGCCAHRPRRTHRDDRGRARCPARRAAATAPPTTTASADDRGRARPPPAGRRRVARGGTLDLLLTHGALSP